LEKSVRMKQPMKREDHMKYSYDEIMKRDLGFKQNLSEMILRKMDKRFSHNPAFNYARRSGR
jgi:hypothetical protein